MPRLSRWLRRRAVPEPVAPDLPLDLRAPAFVQNPYPTLAWLRAHEPLHRAASGAWVLTRHADIDAALKHPDLGNAPAAHAQVHARHRQRRLAADVANNTLPFMDGEAHRGLRQALGRVWAQTLREQPPDYDQAARRHLAVADNGVIDLLADVATPLAVEVIGQVLGVPADRRAALQADAHWLFYLFTGAPDAETQAQVEAGLTRLRAGFTAMLHGPAPAGSVIERLQRLGLADVVAVDNLILLWADGIENVDKGMAAAVAALLARPAQWRRLAADPERARAAADECQRFESPGQWIARVVRQPLEWHGQALAPDQTVMLMLAAANRDPERYVEPDVLDIERAPVDGLAFGKGSHSCLGAALMRRELTALLAVLATDCPRAELSESVAWQARLGHRWPSAVRVALHG